MASESSFDRIILPNGHSLRTSESLRGDQETVTVEVDLDWEPFRELILILLRWRHRFHRQKNLILDLANLNLTKADAVILLEYDFIPDIGEEDLLYLANLIYRGEKEVAYDELEEYPDWINYSPIYRQELYEQNPRPYLDIFTGKEVDWSQRNPTRMNRLVPPTARTEVFQEENLQVEVHDGVRILKRKQNQERLIPVSRYSVDKYGGLFFEQMDEKPSPYCGTFYYYDLSTGIYLTAEHVIAFPNKLRAIKEMIDQGLADSKTYTQVLKSFQNIVNYRYGNLFTLEEIEIGLKSDFFWERFFPFDFNYINDVGEYERSLYALEDPLDQELCLAFRKAGYDILILTRMPGSVEKVIEVLDTRDRDESFNSLLLEIF